MRLRLVREGEAVILGPRLKREQGGRVVAVRAGLLSRKDSTPPVFWLDSRGKRYVAARGENVIGVITGKAGDADAFRVKIGTSKPASLSSLGFEGATKKNRPDMNVGDLVYGKLLVASRDMEPGLVCVDS